MTTGNDFKDFNEQDFINEPYFQEWIISPDEEKTSFWQEFLANYPHKREAIEKAKVFLQAIAFKESWPAGEKIESSLREALIVVNENGKKALVYEMGTRIRPLYKWMGVAAAVLLFIVLGVWFLIERDKMNESAIAVTSKAEDIAPGGDKAILTLADGTKVILDSAGNGAITRQGNVTVIKLNGQLAYNKEGHAATEVLYNTISTPRGGQYQLVLADGSKVWLNAESSLRFPTAFVGKDRKVELAGEGYFEVAHDAAMPFIVQRGEAEVKVLGTHFNINGYEDEPSLKITLLEGKVMVSSRDQTAVLKPRQQAQLQTTNSKLQITNQVDIDEVVAWKNGLFQFEQADIKTIMRQVARWYNVDVGFEGRVPDKKFDGKIYRNTSIKEVFDILEEGGGVRLKINGKKVIVSP